MIKGMTGFGSSELTAGKIKALVEIKSLNHRYLDINFYLPIGFASVEEKIRSIVQKKIERGRVTVSIKFVQKPSQTIILNEESVSKYINYAKVLSRKHKLNYDLHLSDLVKLPGVFETKETMINADQLWPSLDKTVKKTLNSMVSMRAREGKSLIKDIKMNLKQMSLHNKKIRSRANVILRSQKKKLTSEEFQSYQKSSDINEEIKRLDHYIQELKGLLPSNSAVGKKIDFIAQEMQRETNTIGAKLQDKIVSNAVIAIKGRVEKIREQSQNVE